MPLRSHVALVDSALRRTGFHSSFPVLPWTYQRCRYSSTPAAYPERIAVLGGGISGLASAYFVAKEFPKSVITIFEAGKETGGWIRTKHVEVPGGTVAFESGPRTLRNAPVTGHLMQELDLVKDAIFTYKTTPGAMNRYIYYPNRLNRLPSTQHGVDFAQLFSLWWNGLFKGFWSILNERNVRSRPRALVDETIGSFWERRLDKNFANNILSPVIHGIYAGDIWQLSAKTLLPVLWQLEGRYGNLVLGYMKMTSGEGAGVGGPEKKPSMSLTHPQDAETWKAINSDIHLDPQLAQNLKDSAFFTFRNGLQQLVHRLQEEVEKNDNIKIAVNTKVEDTKLVEGEETKVAVTTNTSSSASDIQNYDLVISTLRNTSLTPYVTVMTVNLYYTNPHLNEENPGFGYLIPQSVPFENNPERALGVIFDSSAVTGQDTASGTKFTVMLGGHYWDGWSAYPDEEEGLEMAKNIMQRHLGISDEPAAHSVKVHKDCIPQYTIGYEERLKDFAVGLSEQFKGRLRVVGNQVNGVGVNDCITAAWNLARGLRQGGWKSRSVGLDKYTEEREWVLVPKRDLEYKIEEKR